MSKIPDLKLKLNWKNSKMKDLRKKIIKVTKIQNLKCIKMKFKDY